MLALFRTKISESFVARFKFFVRECPNISGNAIPIPRVVIAVELHYIPLEAKQLCPLLKLREDWGLVRKNGKWRLPHRAV